MQKRHPLFLLRGSAVLPRLELSALQVVNDDERYVFNRDKDLSPACRPSARIQLKDNLKPFPLQVVNDYERDVFNGDQAYQALSPARRPTARILL